MRPTRRTLLLASVPLLLSGCGFALRQAPQFGFRSLYLALPAHSALALELRRQLEGSGSLQVFTDAAQRDKALGLAERPLGPGLHGWVTARDVYKAVLTKAPYPVRMLMSFGTNLLVSQPDTETARKALSALEFSLSPMYMMDCDFL